MILSTIIPTFNGKRLLTQSLPLLSKSLQSISEAETIIIDNNSQDGTEKYIQTNYPTISLIPLKKNIGFTGACNKGAPLSNGNYLLFLNNDCLLENDTISQMLELLQNNKQYCATQPVVKTPNGQIENIGYQVDLTKGKAHVFTQEKDWVKRNDQESVDIFKNEYVNGLSATCLLIKREVFINIGMFDESFHSYLEDVDLFIRLAIKSHKYCPTFNAQCIHHHMSTSKGMNLYKETHDFTNWIRIITKNYPFWFIRTNFFPLFIERLRNLNGIIKKLVK